MLGFKEDFKKTEIVFLRKGSNSKQKIIYIYTNKHYFFTEIIVSLFR